MSGIVEVGSSARDKSSGLGRDDRIHGSLLIINELIMNSAFPDEVSGQRTRQRKEKQERSKGKKQRKRRDRWWRERKGKRKMGGERERERKRERNTHTHTTGGREVKVELLKGVYPLVYIHSPMYNFFPVSVCICRCTYVHSTCSMMALSQFLTLPF